MKPNWDAAPDWARYWAVDSGGHAFWYRQKPVKIDRDGIWNTPRLRYKFDRRIHGYPTRIWKDSLIERPTE